MRSCGLVGRKTLPAPPKSEGKREAAQISPSYQGRKRALPLPLSKEIIATLALEAQVREMRRKIYKEQGRENPSDARRSFHFGRLLAAGLGRR